jgi:MFS family permease
MSLIVAGWMAPRYGWRACFYVLGLAGLAFAAWMAFVRDPRDRDRRRERRAGGDAIGAPPVTANRVTLTAIVRTLALTLRQVPSYGLAIAGGSLLAYGSAAALHAITWLVQERHMPFATAAFTAGVIAVASGFLGNLAGGWFADACQRRMRAGRVWSLVIMTVSCTPFAVTFYLIDAGTVGFYACWFVASAATTAYFGPLFAVVQEVSPVRIRSTTVAFALLGMNLLGVGPGPWITGVIGDHHSLTRGLLISTGVAFTSIIPFALAARTYERDVARARTM